MATLGFLLAPMREIPTEHDPQWAGAVNGWIEIANWHWFELWKGLPAEEQRGVPRMPPCTGLSAGAIDPKLKKEPRLIESAKPWVERAWKAWHESGRKAPLPVVDSAAAHQALGLDSRICLANLTGYSGGFTTLAAAKLKRGGVHGLLKSEGDLNAFTLGETSSTQRELFLEVARGHGGDHLAVWTFGHALHVLVARSPKPGARPVLHGPFSVRARVPAGSKRPGGFVEALESALSGSSLQPDFAALRQEMAKAELSVSKCFDALGLPGARDFASPDTAARWADMEAVGRALLTAQPVDKKQLKNVQEILKPLGDTKLPSSGKLGKGVIGRAVGEVLLELRGALGIPASGPWANRFRAAACYWDICDGGALDRLTAGEDRGGIGTGAAVARLLAHFPEELARDPLFLALLALECEAANGHAYVEGLCVLAEHTTTAGSVLVVAPAAQRAAMRKAFGISAENPDAGPGGSWCGEALIAGTTIAKGDMAETARSWMTKAKATGAVAELLADGSTKIEWYKDGATAKKASDAGLGPVDEAALRKAAKGFLPRAGFVALGGGDVLAPGEWHEGSYSGGGPAGAEDHKAKKRRHAEKLLDSPAEPQSLKHAGDLRTVLGSGLRYIGPLQESDGGIVSFRIVPPAVDGVWLRDMRMDLKGRGVIYLYGEVWEKGGEIRAYTCSDLDLALLGQLLGDVPAGTLLAVGVGAELRGAWRIG